MAPVHITGPADLGRVVRQVTATALRDGEDLMPDGLVPRLGPEFALALLLAVQCPDAYGWLGADRLRRIAEALQSSEAGLLRMLDGMPRPLAALGDLQRWSGRRVPIAWDGSVGWLDLFWRPDRDARRPRIGAFAARLSLPGLPDMEIRGRLEERRLDMVAETAAALPRAGIADAEESFGRTLARLGLEGSLTLRGSTGSGPARETDGH